MNLDLTAVRGKLARGQEHSQAINNEIKAWIDRKPYSLTQHTNSDSTRYSLVLRENEPAPFQRWTLMFADCLGNLRSALDYLIYAIAISESRLNPPPKGDILMFPITDSRSKFDDAVRRGRLGEISKPVRAVVESFQPYHRPHPKMPPLLSILRDLNNTDKHRLLNLAYAAVRQGELCLEGAHPPDGRGFQVVPNAGEAKDGTEVVAMVYDRPTPNMHWAKIGILINVVIWHGKRDPSVPDFMGHTEVSGLLDLLSDEIRTVIHAFVK